MPYMVVKRDGKHCVHKRGADGEPEGESMGCHDSEEEAMAQIQAIGARTHMGKTLTVEAMRELCPGCAERMERLGIKALDPEAWWEAVSVKAGNIAALAQHLAKKYGGDPGYFSRSCMQSDELAEYDEETRAAICARAHKEATGIWPGEHRGKSVGAGRGDLTGIADDDNPVYAPVDSLTYQGGAVKALGDGRIGGYLVRFTSPDSPDLTGEYFDANTDFGDAEKSPVYFEHGLDPIMGKRKIGPATFRRDEFGIWAETQLARRDQYEQFIYRQAEAGKAGWSSGTAPHLVEREPRGNAVYLRSWPLGLDASITLTPAEPRNVALPLKSLTVTPLEAMATAEAEQSAPVAPEAVTAVPTIKTESTVTEGTTMAENENPQGDALGELKTQLETLTAAVKGLTTPTGAGYRIAPADGTGAPFKSAGEFLQTVARNPHDSRLANVRSEWGFDYGKALGQDAVWAGLPGYAIKANPTGMGETIPSSAGVLVGNQMMAGILARVYEVGALLSRIPTDPIGDGFNSATYLAESETSRADGSRRGGVRAYWRSEASTVTATKPAFRRVNLTLDAVEALTYITNEQLEDAAMLGGYLSRIAPEELRFVAEDSLINGLGTGQPLGALNNPALVTVSKESGQQADTLVAENISKMWSRRWLGYNDYIWLYNQELEPQFDYLAASVGTGGQLVYLGPGGLRDAPSVTIKGRPAFASEYCQGAGTVGDIILLSPSAFVGISKGGITEASSIHVKFVEGETVFKWTWRVNFGSLWNSALTPKNSTATATVSPFVVLEAR